MIRARATFACCGAPALADGLRQHKCNTNRAGGNGMANHAPTRNAAASNARGVHAMESARGVSAARRQPTSRPGRAAEDALADQLARSGFNVLTWGEWLLWAMHGMACESSAVVREARWGQALVPERRFRADFLLPAHLLMVEVEGGAHGVQRQRKHDVLRDQLAQQAGYRILRVLPEQIATGDALALVRAAVKGGGE